MDHEPKRLTLKQRRFIEEYVGPCRGNARASAEAAGYAGTDETLCSVGYENLRKPQILAEINHQLTARTLSSAEVLYRLSEHANGTIAHFLRRADDGVWVDLSQESAKANLHLLKKAKSKRRSGGTEEAPWEEIVTEIEMHDAQAALVHIGRYYGMFTDKMPKSVSVTASAPDGKATVTAIGADMVEVQLLALHNDILAKALLDAGVELPDDLRAPNINGCQHTADIEDKE